MGVKWRKNLDITGRITAAAGELNGRRVEVGPKGEENAKLARIHEYGCRITVKPNQRARLHRMGIHLKKSTTQIVIPERSFLRTGHDMYIDMIAEQAARMAALALVGKMPAGDVLSKTGDGMANKIKNYMKNNISPPIASITAQLKGSTRPLYDSGALIGSIGYEVV